MTIATLDDIDAATKQGVMFLKRHAKSNAFQHGMWGEDDDPPGGSYSIGNTANGLVPTSATTGAPFINSFNGTSGFICAVEVDTNIRDVRGMLYDRLFHAGTYAMGSGTTTLSSQPSYTSRLPGGSYGGTCIFYEAAAASGACTLTVTYTNQAGTAGRSTGAFSVPDWGGGSGYFYQMPLASGDSGVQKIESVTVTGGTSGGLNIVVARPLFYFRAIQPTQPSIYTMEDLGLPQIFDDSCLAMMTFPDGTLLPNTALNIQVING